MKSLKLRVFSSFLFFLIIFHFSLFTFHLNGVNAQQIVPLAISPAKQEVLLKKGEQKNLDVTVFNKGSKPIVGNFRILDFIVQEADGTPIILENSPYPDRSARSWIITQNDEVVVEPQKSYTAQIIVTVPSDAKAGGRYAAVLFQPSLTTEEGSTNVSVRIASLLNIKVAGKTEEGVILSLLSSPSFLESGPAQLNFSVTNTGDYHIVPKGRVELTNMFERAVDESEIEKLNIFPDSSRLYKTTLGKGFLLGPYHTRLSLTYGEENKRLREKRLIFIFPWKLFLIVLLGSAILYYMSRSLNQRGSSSTSSAEYSSEDLSELKKKLKRRDV